MNQVRDLFPDPGLTSRGMVRLRRIRWMPVSFPRDQTCPRTETRISERLRPAA